MKLAALTEAGLEAFITYLAFAKNKPSALPPTQILTEEGFVEILDINVDVDEAKVFASRFEFAAYADSIFGDDIGHSGNVGMWAWLTVLYFDQVCPLVQGSRKVLELARYVPAHGNFRKYYRHLLSGPFHVYLAHRDDPSRSRVVLSGPLHAPGELAEQLLAGQERMTNRAVLEAAGNLYMDAKSGKLRRGAGGKGAGSPRRFVDMLNQFDLTYDLYSLDGKRLLAMLPAEFDRFRSEARMEANPA